MAILFANNAYGTLSGSISDAATSIALATGNGARFPNPTGGDYFLATLIGIDGNGNESSWEVVKVTARSSDTLTVTRAQEGTAAAVWAGGTRIELRATKGTFESLLQTFGGTLAGDLVFSGTGRRIQADFSNATLANRAMFRTSTTNGNTTVSALPNGTATAAQYAVYAGSDPDNAPFGALLATATQIQIISNKTGTASAQSLAVVVGGTTLATFGASGGFTIDTGAVFSKDIKEAVYTITDGTSVDLNPANGTLQVWTLGASRSPTASNFADGQSMTLMIDDGSGWAISSWPSVTWKTGGGVAPTLNTTGYTAIVLWKAGSTLYGARVGDA